MFGTLRFDAHSDDTEFIERVSVNDLNGQGSQHYSACDKCRSKKVGRRPASATLIVLLVHVADPPSLDDVL
jgi:hypothetical protein